MTSSAPVQSALGGIDYSPRTRLIFGEGCVARVGELVRELQGSRVLLVTDPGIAKAGHTEGVIRAIERVGAEVFLYDQVRENPTTRDVQSCVVPVGAWLARDGVRLHNQRVVIGSGGGSLGPKSLGGHAA